MRPLTEMESERADKGDVCDQRRRKARGSYRPERGGCWFEVTATVVNKDGQSGRRDTLVKRDDVM